MKTTQKNNAAGIWLSALILLMSVAVSAVALFGRLDGYLPDDTGAICLLAAEQAHTGGSTPPTAPTPTEQPRPTEQTPQPSAPAATEPAPTETEPPATQPPKNPGFEAGDDQTVWETSTQVEIFRISYENGAQVITVQSGNGDKIIAPGTENSYLFKLKNTGDVTLEYTVEIDAYFTPSDIAIPITGRLNRYDGKWVVGGKNEYATVSALDAAKDNGTLGAGKYTYYTLDWMWPFEGGSDELDTMLGNLAAEQELAFTIVIRTTAEESEQPGGGITPPQTGDLAQLPLWIALAVGSLGMILLLLGGNSREKRRFNAEADGN